MVALLAVAALLGLIPALIASHKGLSVAGFWLFGTVLLIPALIVVLCVPPTATSAAALKARYRQSGSGSAANSRS